MQNQSRPSLTVCGLEGVLAPLMGASSQACDVAAAQLFCTVGGQLTVFTHRGPAAAQAALGKHSTNLPVATCGGALLFDLNKNCMVQARPISVQAGRAILQFALGELDRVGVVGVDDHGQTCLLRANREAQMLLNREGGLYRMIPPEAASLSWCKLAVCGSAHQIARMKTFLLNRDDLPVTILHQDAVALELVAAQVQPRETMRRLCNMADCVQQQVVAVISQPKDTIWAAHAGRVIAMADAPEALRSAVSGVLDSYRNGGAGEYLYWQAAEMQGPL